MLYFCCKAKNEICKTISKRDLELIKESNTQAYEVFKTLQRDLSDLNIISYVLRKDYKFPLNFYPKYQLTLGLYDDMSKIVSINGEDIPSRLSFALETKDDAVLVPLIKYELLSISDKTKKKNLNILTLKDLAEDKNEYLILGTKIFPKNVLVQLVSGIISLNKKLSDLYSKSKTAVICYEKRSLADTQKLLFNELSYIVQGS